ncbi:MAG: DUF1735 domain-containing protein [Chitinophagaceae bacterium]
MKKIMNRKYFMLLAMLAGLIGIGSCKKDVASTEPPIAYPSGNNGEYNQITVTIPMVGSKPIISDLKIPVVLTRAVQSNVQVTAKINTDSSARIAYNTQYLETFELLPIGSCTLVNNGVVTIKSGNTQSSDSVTVHFTDFSNVDISKTYLLPITLESATGGVDVSDARNTMYVVVSFLNISVSIPSSGSNTLQAVINITPDSSVSAEPVPEFAATINHGISFDIKINVQQNDSLIAAYNMQNGTNYIPFPKGSFQLAKSEVNIPAGSTVSSDLFQIKLTNVSAFTSLDMSYILPLQLKNDPANPPVDDINNVVYVIVKVRYENIDPSNSGLEGTTMSRETWTATSPTGESFVFPASNTIDGDNSSIWKAAELPGAIDIDMGSTQTVKGFFVVPGYFFNTILDFTQVEILSSNDGNNWRSQGTYNGPPLFDQNPVQIKFIGPVTARYFRVNLITSSNWLNQSAIAEIDGVQ